MCFLPDILIAKFYRISGFFATGIAADLLYIVLIKNVLSAQVSPG
jgi:hypothetical protein